MFGSIFGERAGKRDLQTLKDAEGNDWFLLYEVNTNSSGLYAMAIDPQSSLPCQVHLVQFPISEAEQKRHTKFEQKCKDEERERKRKHLTVVDDDEPKGEPK